MNRTLPLLATLVVLAMLWLGASIAMNWPQAADEAEDGAPWTTVLAGAMALDRPLLPAPQQVVGAVTDGVFGAAPTSPRSLVYHAGVTTAAAALGFLMAVGAGGMLAIVLAHVRMLDRAMMPWVVASQTVPILAIAPMLITVLGNLGLQGLVPKAIIAGWLSFFPVTMALSAGLRAPDRMQLDLMRTYAATRRQTFMVLRWPGAMAFLFPGLKVASALCLVGAIVAELPTGAQAGLGARLLAGSYYGQPLQIWAALVVASLLSLAAVGVVQAVQAGVTWRRGGRL